MPDTARGAETVRCADCDSPHERYDAYEVREPQAAENGTTSTRTFWLCRKCWDGIVSGALLSRVRGF